MKKKQTIYQNTEKRCLKDERRNVYIYQRLLILLCTNYPEISTTHHWKSCKAVQTDLNFNFVGIFHQDRAMNIKIILTIFVLQKNIV